MTDQIYRAESVADVQGVIRDAMGPLAIEGGGGLRGLGRPVQAEATLKLDALTGVVEYSPTELYCTFRAGTTLDDARATLKEKSQRLPFDPPDMTGLYGDADDGGPATVGGVVAAALSGPARIATGAARDYVIGVNFVDGQGQAMHGGGRVMKNVTGYDICKLATGAFGTLGAIVDITFKVLPVAPTERTLVILGLDDAAGQAALSAALKSPFEPMAAAHLPAATATAPAIAAAAPGGGQSVTALRLEGFAESLAYRAAALRAFLPTDVEILEIEGEASAAFWSAVRDAAPFQGHRAPLWRISTAPTAGPKIVAALANALPVRALYDWAGGLVWLETGDDTPDAGAGPIRAAVQAHGGHATLMRAPETVRAAVDVFQPLPAPIRRLTQGLKASFDPQGLLNPGRMYAGV